MVYYSLPYFNPHFYKGEIMKKTALFFILENYSDWESAYLSTAIHDLSEGKMQVKTVSISSHPIKTIGGFTTLPDYTLENVPEDFVGLFLIGGNSWKSESANLVLPLVQKTLENNKILGGICAASEFLAAHGFLNHVKHTSNGLDSLLKRNNSLYNNKANYINEQAVRDKNIITANGTGTLEFCRECSKALSLASNEIIEQEYLFDKKGFCEMTKT